MWISILKAYQIQYAAISGEMGVFISIRHQFVTVLGLTGNRYTNRTKLEA
jgi:hypothetical protein